MPTYYLFSTNNTNMTVKVLDPTPQELRPEPGMFVFEFEYTGLRFFAKATGRTRLFWHEMCPTFERYAIETVVIDGAIWGVPGAKVNGTFAIRPRHLAGVEAVTAE